MPRTCGLRYQFRTRLFWAVVKNANVGVPSHKTFSWNRSGACGLASRFLKSSWLIPGRKCENDGLRGLREVLVRFSSCIARCRQLVTAEQLRTHADADALQTARQAAEDPTVPLVQGPVAQLLLPSLPLRPCLRPVSLGKSRRHWKDWTSCAVICPCASSVCPPPP